jgi:CubicO group peptidase (beta-lactamase class C family)
MRLLYSLLVALFLSVSTSCSQPTSQADEFAVVADSFIASALQGINGIPGVSIAVVRGSEVVYLRAFGDADREAGIEATPDTPYYIASSTKSFTALLAVLLDREGVIDLDLSLAEAFPDVTFSNDVRAQSASLRSLLSHTHGIENDPIVRRTAFTGEHTPEVLHGLLSASTPNAEAPLGTFQYTNVGYNILSIYLDRTTGQRWQDLLDDRIFTPAGMEHTTAYASEPDRGGWGKAAPYGPFGENGPERLYLEKQDNTMQAAGGMYASARDLARWVILQLNDGQLDGDEVFPEDIIKQVHEPVAVVDANYGPFLRTGYGLGWYTGTYDSEAMMHHFGGFGGAHAHVSFLPERDLGMVVLINESDVGGRLATLVSTFAYEWWLGRPDVVARFEGQRDELAAGFGQFREQFRQGIAERAKRTWTITLAPGAYAGTYRNEHFGTIEVMADGRTLSARYGNMRAVATPFTAPETMRVEFVPGQGEVIAFQVAAGRVAALRFDGAVFDRVE